LSFFRDGVDGFALDLDIVFDVNGDLPSRVLIGFGLGVFNGLVGCEGRTGGLALFFKTVYVFKAFGDDSCRGQRVLGTRDVIG